MQLKDFADLASSLSVVVAALAFVLALIERTTRERKSQLLGWQRVVVYRLVEDGISEFEQIKLHYVVAAQQYPDFKIPTRDIQDGALKLVILSLIEARLISRTDEGDYVVNVISLQENQLKNLAFAQVHKQMGVARLTSQLYEALERESGKFTVDQLYRHLDGKALGHEFEDFNVFVRDLVNRGVLVFDREQRLWLRSRIPPPQVATQQNTPKPGP
jgi:hypothetical protein